MIPWNKGLKGVYKLSEETRRKKSEGLKGRIPWHKGKHHSEEIERKYLLPIWVVIVRQSWCIQRYVRKTPNGSN